MLEDFCESRLRGPREKADGPAIPRISTGQVAGITPIEGCSLTAKLATHKHESAPVWRSQSRGPGVVRCPASYLAGTQKQNALRPYWLA